MVTVIPGSDLLTSALNVVSQSLQIPVIIFLLLFALYAVITVGGLISEYTSRKKVPVRVIKDLIFSISRTKEISEIEDVIKPAQIPKNQKRVLVNIARSSELSVVDKNGRECERYKLPYGTILSVADGDEVKKGENVASWDPHTTPIISEFAGKASFLELIDLL